MEQQRTKADFTGQPIYVGLDVHRKSWRVSIMTSHHHHKTFTQHPSPETLLGYLDRMFPGATVHCVYEAGFSGFSAARALQARGVSCLVVHPPDIPRSERDRLQKSDRIDAQRLATELRNGTLRSVYIPSIAAVEDRSLVRMRRTFVRKQTRCKAQIRMYLHQHGVVIPVEYERSWSQDFLRWLSQVEFTRDSGRLALGELLRELYALREQLQDISKQIQRMSQQEEYRTPVELLRTVPGVGLITAMVLLTELIDIRRFPTSDDLAQYAGLTPGGHSSGDRYRSRGITKRRNRVLRHILIESAWTAVREDPALLEIFEKATSRMVKSKAIVLVAHRLLNRIRAVLLTGVPYEIGCRTVRTYRTTRDEAGCVG